MAILGWAGIDVESEVDHKYWTSLHRAVADDHALDLIAHLHLGVCHVPLEQPGPLKYLALELYAQS